MDVLQQVMAVGTLAACYNNHGVFTGVVKMRRGAVAKYMSSLTSVEDTYLAFAHYGCALLAKYEQPEPAVLSWPLLWPAAWLG